MQRQVRKLGQLTLLLALVLVSGSAGPVEAHSSGHTHPHQGGGFRNVNTSGGTLNVRAMEWMPAGGVDLEEDDCPEESGSIIQVRDDFSTPVTPGFYLVDPVNNAHVIHQFTLSGAAGIDVDTRLFSPTGRWIRYNCGNAFYLFAEGGPAMTFDGLLRDVIDQLDPPDPPLAVTPDHGSHVVNMPSWFAIDPAYWYEVRTAEARPAGSRFFVEASLAPTHIEWDPGNGHLPPPCDNPGTVWQAGLTEDANDCEYIYPLPSINPPNNTWEMSGTVVFEVVNVRTSPGLNPAEFGPWPPVIRTSTQTIEVVEIQAVSQTNPTP